MPRYRRDDLTDAEAIAHVVTSAARRRADAAVPGYLSGCSGTIPKERPATPARPTVDGGWPAGPPAEDEREGAV